FCRNLNGNVSKPFIRSGTMPMLNLRRNVYNVTWMQFSGWLLPFLVPAFSIRAKQNLAAFMMNMPVVAALWFKGYIVYAHTLCAQRLQITVSAEILCICCVRISKPK